MKIACTLFRMYFLLLCLLFSAKYVFAESLPVQLLSERYRTEWNWVEYRITLKNTSSEILFNPEIRYIAKGESFSATIDYSTWLYPVVASVDSVGELSVVKLKVNAMLYSGDSVEIHFRIYRDGYLNLLNSSQDWSFQHNENVIERNYFMPVYDGFHNLLWGFDPLNGKKNADVILWSERGVNKFVEKFSGYTSEVVPAGRFWLFKESPLSSIVAVSIYIPANSERRGFPFHHTLSSIYCL